MLLLSNLLALMLVAADSPALASPDGPPARIAAPAPMPAPTWNLALGEAIRLGLANSPILKVVAPPVGSGPVAGPPGRQDRPANIAITRVDGGADEWKFQSDIMAHVRSIEQQYWVLSEQQTTVWIREAVVRMGEDIIRRERADLEGGQRAGGDPAIAERQLADFKASLDAARADRATIERQFRNILGAPAEDNRPMVAVTPPYLMPVQPRWDACLAEMIARNPDIEAARRAQADAGSRADLDKQKALYDQVLQASTRTLARFALEVDVDHKALVKAQSLKAVAQQRLQGQRAFYDEGRITANRLFEALAQYANAVAQEGQSAAAYNTSLAAFEEAQGTILSSEGVQIINPPRRPEGQAKGDAPARDEQITTTSPDRQPR